MAIEALGNLGEKRVPGPHTIREKTIGAFSGWWSKAEILLKWLEEPEGNYPTALTHNQAVQILPVFKEALELTPPNSVREHLEEQIKIIMNEISMACHQLSQMTEETR